MSDLPADCVAQILQHYSVLERLKAGRVCKTWLSASRSKLANATLTPADLAGKSLPLAQKYAFESAMSVKFNSSIDASKLKLPSVKHIEFVNSPFTGTLFKQLVTNVLDASNIISFINMDVQYSVETALPYLALLKHIQRLKITSGHPDFILQALKQLTTLVSVSIQRETLSRSLVDIVTSQATPVLWNDLMINLRYDEHLFFAILPTHLPHLTHLHLLGTYLSRRGENLQISHPTLERFVFAFRPLDQKINVDMPAITYCRIATSGEGPAELSFAFASMLQRLDIGVDLLRSISFSSVSPPTCLKHVSFQNLGYHDADHTVGMILSSCKALETLQISGGKYFEYFQLQNVASPVLRDFSIVNCKDLHTMSIANNSSLQKLQNFNLSGNAKLTSIFLDTATSPLPTLETLDVSYCSILDVDNLALFCSQVTSLQKLTASNLPKNMLMAALDVYPALKSLQVEGRLMADAIWKAKHVMFNQGGLPGDPGMYGNRRRGHGVF